MHRTGIYRFWLGVSFFPRCRLFDTPYNCLTIHARVAVFHRRLFFLVLSSWLTSIIWTRIIPKKWALRRGVKRAWLPLPCARTRREHTAWRGYFSGSLFSCHIEKRRQLNLVVAGNDHARTRRTQFHTDLCTEYGGLYMSLPEKWPAGSWIGFRLNAAAAVPATQGVHMFKLHERGRGFLTIILGRKRTKKSRKIIVGVFLLEHWQFDIHRTIIYPRKNYRNSVQTTMEGFEIWIEKKSTPSRVVWTYIIPRVVFFFSRDHPPRVGGRYNSPYRVCLCVEEFLVEAWTQGPTGGGLNKRRRWYGTIYISPVKSPVGGPRSDQQTCFDTVFGVSRLMSRVPGSGSAQKGPLASFLSRRDLFRLLPSLLSSSSLIGTFDICMVIKRGSFGNLLWGGWTYSGRFSADRCTV